MDILIDAQLPPSLVRLLASAGHQARHVRTVGLRDATDPAIWDYAVREGAVIFTKDEDFALSRLHATAGIRDRGRASHSDEVGEGPGR